MREPKEIFLRFPVKGINVSVPRTQQPPDTCIDCQNVRISDTISNRDRGGIRPGMSKYVTGAFNGSNRIQDINYATVIANSTPAANSLSYRSIKNVAVSGGTVIQFTTSTKTNATASGSQTLSNTVPFIFSSELFGKLYYVDGTSYKIWVGANNTTTDWTPSAGSLPGTDGTVAPRLIEMWRGRMVLSGLRTDPHNWFMSRLGDPLDWDYAPTTVTETDPVQGGVGIVGKVGDVINCMIPYSDDVLFFGCDHSIWQMAGDPQAGGRLDLLSGTVGTAFGRPYCQDPHGTIYFFSSRGNVYKMAGGGSNPESLTSDSIEKLLTNTDLNTTYVRMEWDEDQYGFHLFLTPFVKTTTDHWFYDLRSQGWFRDRLASTDFGPTAVKTIDADDPDDRVLLMGGFDSIIRKSDRRKALDDGNPMTAYVIIGPSEENSGKTPIILTELQALTDNVSAPIKYEVLVGDTPDSAVNTASSTFAGNSTWAPGFGVVRNPRVRGHYIYYKIGTTSAVNRWALEQVRAKIQVVKSGTGRSRIATVEGIVNHPLLVYAPTFLLDAHDTIESYSDQDVFDHWRDLTLNGNDFIEAPERAGVANYANPLYRTTSVNGHPGIQFKTPLSQPGRLLKSANGVILNQTSGTLLYVLVPLTGDDTLGVVFGASSANGSSSGNSQHITYSDNAVSGSRRRRIRRNVSGSFTETDSNTPVWVSNTRYTGILTGNGSGYSWQSNNTAINITTNNTGLWFGGIGSLTRMWIGDLITNANVATASWQGHIGLMAGWNRVLSASEINSVLTIAGNLFA
jgi:hypothetical protein